MEYIENKTNPGADPVEGDYVVYRFGKSLVTRQYHDPVEPSAEEIAEIARSWRDLELAGTDWIVPVTDHPQHAAYLAYRQALRDWPSTADFPDTRPELGA